MIDVEQAVRTAVDYCQRLFGDRETNFVLEEVVLSDDEKHWLITVGFEPVVSGYEKKLQDVILGRPPLKQKYKVVDIDSETGVVRSVKIRDPLERVA